MIIAIVIAVVSVFVALGGITCIAVLMGRPTRHDYHRHAAWRDQPPSIDTPGLRASLSTGERAVGDVDTRRVEESEQ